MNQPSSVREDPQSVPQVLTSDNRVLCADGIYRWFNARGAPVLNKDGSVREWVGVCLNVPGRNRYGSSEGTARPSAARDPSAAPLPGDEPPTPGQIRAARAFVGLSKEDLAGLSNVSVSTINRLEDPNSPIRTRSETAIAVRRALEKAGIEFTFEEGAKPGVREA